MLCLCRSYGTVVKEKIWQLAKCVLISVGKIGIV